MSSGVPILGTVTRPCTVYKTGDKSFSIILTQGLNRQIRRMCEYLGYHVCTLKRIRIMNLTLDGLKCGEYREICGDEWKKLNELIRDSSSETVIRTGGQHGNISGRTNKRTGAEAERSGKGILSGRPGDHEQQRVRRTVRSTGKNGKGNRNRSGRQPNCNVGYEAVDVLPKETHESPMLSLDKTKDRDVLRAFIGTHPTLLSWKMDGLTIVLTYENGELLKAVYQRKWYRGRGNYK